MLLTRRLFLKGASSTAIIPALSYALVEEKLAQEPITDRSPIQTQIDFIGDGPLEAKNYLSKPDTETRLVVNGQLIPSVKGLSLSIRRDFLDVTTVNDTYRRLPLFDESELDFTGLCDPKFMDLIGERVSVKIVPAGGSRLYSGDFLVTNATVLM